jgi:hypothetical protein
MGDYELEPHEESNVRDEHSEGVMEEQIAWAAELVEQLAAAASAPTLEADSSVEERISDLPYPSDFELFQQQYETWNLADVVASAESFRIQWKWCREQKIRMLCLEDSVSGPIPIDWLGSIAGYGYGFVRASLLGYKEVATRLESGESIENVVLPLALVDPDEAQQRFENGLTDFVSVRGAGSQGPGYTSAGLKFRVVTETRGLRVHYTPSYFISWRVFGAPTSPVDGWIQPGQYKFGAVGTNYTFRYDSADFEIPPRTEAILVKI